MAIWNPEPQPEVFLKDGRSGWLEQISRTTSHGDGPWPIVESTSFKVRMPRRWVRREFRDRWGRVYFAEGWDDPEFVDVAADSILTITA